MSDYALALQLAALRAELAGFDGLAAAFRAMLAKELRRRGQCKRTYGVLHPMRADRTAFQHVEPPGRRFWWQDAD